jgi:uncharacterized membrane protein HdeD (DUF308 family)
MSTSSSDLETPSTPNTPGRARGGSEAGFLLAVSDSWPPALVIAGTSIVLGLAALAWPASAVRVVALLLAAQLVIYGALCLARAAGRPGTGGDVRMMVTFLGVFGLLIGVLTLRDGTHSVTVLALLTGLFWFVGGALGILGALVRRTGSSHVLEILTDLIAVVVGVAVLAFPGISLGVLTSILGTWIAVFGVLVVVTAYHRKARGQPA